MKRNTPFNKKDPKKGSAVLKQTAVQALSNSSSKASFGFSKMPRFGGYSKSARNKRVKVYDQNSFFANPSMYTPAPGMYNVGSIFGK